MVNKLPEKLSRLPFDGGNVLQEIPGEIISCFKAGGDHIILRKNDTTIIIKPDRSVIEFKKAIAVNVKIEIKYELNNNT